MITKELDTPIGRIVASATPAGICFLNFADKTSEFIVSTNDIDNEASEHIITLQRELKEYFNGVRREFSVSLDIQGSEFCVSVWKKLLEIPYGTTRTYMQQAEEMNVPLSIRAVAKANALNRIAIIIPCHRIIGTGGKLTGYSGGIERKRWLLIHEKKHSQKTNDELF